jgi:hypothetical protein
MISNGKVSQGTWEGVLAVRCQTGSKQVDLADEYNRDLSVRVTEALRGRERKEQDKKTKNRKNTKHVRCSAYERRAKDRWGLRQHK